MLVLTLSCSAMALSDEEYLRMKKASSDFARADENLSFVWKRLKSQMSAREFRILRDEQREWLDGWRDEDARMLMEKGYSRIEAYTIATNERADYIQIRAKYIMEHGE